MSADITILREAVEEYIASMSPREFDILVATTRDPEEKKSDTDTREDNLDTIGDRMFGDNK